MNKKNAKKALLLVLCAILLVVASVMGTLAYLTDSKEIQNTFAVGKVKITLDETVVNPDGTDKDDPAVRTATGNEYLLIPGSTYKKDPIVHIEEGSESCYVFIKVVNNIESVEAAGATDIEAQIAANGWTALDAENHPGVYHKVWEKGTSDRDLETFAEFKIDGSATNDSLAGIGTKTIVITAYAIQKTNIADAATAWAALNPATP